MRQGEVAHDYSVKVFRSGEDEGYIAVCPELHGISAFGESREDALRELDVAIDLVLEDMRETGEPIPEPTSKKAYSGKFNVRVSKSLHAQIASAAEEDEVSLNTKVVELLSQGVAGPRKPPRRVEPKKKAAAKRSSGRRR